MSSFSCSVALPGGDFRICLLSFSACSALCGRRWNPALVDKLGLAHCAEDQTGLWSGRPPNNRARPLGRLCNTVCQTAAEGLHY